MPSLEELRAKLVGMPEIVARICCVYEIRCLATGKRYIGSSMDVSLRWREHKNQLRRSKHHSVILQNCWNKYGESNFEFSILELVDGDPMLVEQRWLDEQKPELNVNPNANAPMRGKKRSLETRAKHSASIKGVPRPNSRGIKHTPEHREKIRRALAGRPAWNKGIPAPEHVKSALKASLFGNKHLLGKHFTESTKAQMRSSQAARRAREKAQNA